MNTHLYPEALVKFMAKASAMPLVESIHPESGDGKTWYVDVVRTRDDPTSRRLQELIKELSASDKDLSFRVFGCVTPGWAEIMASGDDLPVETEVSVPEIAQFIEEIQVVPGSLVEVRKVRDLGYTVTVYNCSQSVYEEARKIIWDIVSLRVDLRDRSDDPPPSKEIR
jgi:hypothetical protein